MVFPGLDAQLWPQLPRGVSILSPLVLPDICPGAPSSALPWAPDACPGLCRAGAFPQGRTHFCGALAAGYLVDGFHPEFSADRNRSSSGVQLR